MNRVGKRLIGLKQDIDHSIRGFNDFLRSMNDTGIIGLDVIYIYHAFNMFLISVLVALFYSSIIFIYIKYLNLVTISLATLTSFLIKVLLTYGFFCLISFVIAYLLFRVGEVYGDTGFLTKWYVSYLVLVNLVVIALLGILCLLASFKLVSLHSMLQIIPNGLVSLICFGDIWGLILFPLMLSKVGVFDQLVTLLTVNAVLYSYAWHAGMVTTTGLRYYVILALVFGVVAYVLNMVTASDHNQLKVSTNKKDVGV